MQIRLFRPDGAAFFTNREELPDDGGLGQPPRCLPQEESVDSPGRHGIWTACDRDMPGHFVEIKAQPASILGALRTFGLEPT